MIRTTADGHNNNQFVDNNPTAQPPVPGTIVDALWLNNIQEELCHVVEDAGLAIDQSGNTKNQLRQALDKLFFPAETGDLKHTFNPNLRPGWLFTNGETIGNTGSGATARANADTYDLFVMIWNNTVSDRSVVEIYDAAGTLTVFGTDADTDFNDNKRITLPDLRGRTLIGLDNMGGTSKNLITGAWASAYMGGGGTPTHTLTAAQMPAHLHTGNTSNDGSHSHSVNSHGHGTGRHSHPYPTQKIGGYSGASKVSFSSCEENQNSYWGSAENFINANGGSTNTELNHSHSFTTNSAGSSQPHNIIQPSMTCNILIKL